MLYTGFYENDTTYYTAFSFALTKFTLVSPYRFWYTHFHRFRSIRFLRFGGLLEMLVQSRTGELHIFQCCLALRSGYINGLCARGGFELSLKSASGQLVSLEVLSKTCGKCNIHYTGKTIAFDTTNGKAYRLNEELQLQ